MEVWNGIKSYVSTIIKKIDRDIGIAPDLARVSIIQVMIVLTDTHVKKKFAAGLCIPFVDISLRASFYTASHFSK